MRKTVVLNVVGLTRDLLGEHTPRLSAFAGDGRLTTVDEVLPAVTCSAQATYLTGTLPSEHGIVGNGWYFREECEVRFWRRSDRLVQRPKIWELAKAAEPRLTCANLFWRYNTYSSADYTVVERPMYPADGRKIPDIYTQPFELRPWLKEELGDFPLFNFWGPNSTIVSSRWIAEAAKRIEARHAPTLSLVYLPHLDYNLQRQGPGGETVASDLREIDEVAGDLIDFYRDRGARVVVLSEYGIGPVSRPVHLNRLLRERGMLAIRDELGHELLEPGMSAAFAVADHQIAHVYVNDRARLQEVRTLLEETPGVERVLGEDGKRAHGLDHERAGEFVVVAEQDAWFTYYYWNDDALAPDFARTVDIHRKPGYDPADLFVDPKIDNPKLKVGGILLKKKLGFRYLMDVIGLDPSLVQGSHGRPSDEAGNKPLFITDTPDLLEGDGLAPTEVSGALLEHVLG